MNTAREPETNVDIRTLHWSRDGEALMGFDTGFLTDWIYAARRGELSMALVEQACAQPFTKR